MRVLPSQAGNTAVSEGVLGFRDAAKQADALAIAPYMPYSIGRGKTADLGAQMKDWTVDQMLDHFEQTAFADSLERMRRGKAVADKYGVEADRLRRRPAHGSVREGPGTGQEDQRHHARLQSSSANGRLYAATSTNGQRSAATCSRSSRRLAGYSNHGAWGLAEFYDSQPSEYPKLDAVLQWARQHGQPVVEAK